MALTREEVQVLIKLSEKATKGTWIAENVNGVVSDEDDTYVALATCRDDHNEQNNAEFIAQSRNLMPQLAQEWLDKDEQIRQMRENILPKIARCVEAIEYYMGGPWNCDGPSSIGNAFHVHECIRDIRQALTVIDAGESEER